jgi:hypothetical protein
MNSAKKTKPQNDTIHVAFLFFCFSLCISNLIMKILGNVNTHLMNTNKFLPKFYDTYKIVFCEKVSWYHIGYGITRYFSLGLTLLTRCFSRETRLLRLLPHAHRLAVRREETRRQLRIGGINAEATHSLIAADTSVNAVHFRDYKMSPSL